MSESDNILKKAGIHLDELNRLRLLAPDAWETTVNLQTQSREFTAILGSFDKSVHALIAAFEEMAALVDVEKMRAMSLRNELKSCDSQSTTDTKQTQVLIRQRQVELERLKTELAAAQRVEAEQREFMQRFTQG